MAQCAAVRKRGVDDRCGAHAISGHTLCGRHVRARDVKLWADAHRHVDIARVQAMIRGWLVRKRLTLAGPGVLRRANLANSEDLVTCEEKDRVSPYEYFAFTENGKTWWFEFGTLWAWCQRNHRPVNPYTKVPLDVDTRKRIRAMWACRRLRHEDMPIEPVSFEDRLRGRWNILCQAFEDNGFVDVHPNQFMELGKGNYATAFRFLRSDLPVSMAITNPYLRHFMMWVARGLRNATQLPTSHYVLQSSYVLMMMVSTPTDPYITVFNVLSALYRC